jgi:pyridoxal phosphate-dependent aminotransferase EpsN
MSNILAAVGRAQLRVLEHRVAARRRNFERYREALGGLTGLDFMPEAPYGKASRWLTCVLLDAAEFGATSEDVRLALEAEDVEARPLWKPMHLQPVFRDCRTRGGAFAEGLFAHGLCLPSGSGLTPDDIDRICSVISDVHRTRGTHKK